MQPPQVVKHYFRRTPDPNFPSCLPGIHDTDFNSKPDEPNVKRVLELITLCSTIHVPEDVSLPQVFNPLRGRAVQKVPKGPYTPGGILTIERGNPDISPFLLEHKRSIGKDGCDSSVQTAYSLRNLFPPQFSPRDAFRVFCTFLRRVSDMTLS